MPRVDEQEMVKECSRCGDCQAMLGDHLCKKCLDEYLMELNNGDLTEQGEENRMRIGEEAKTNNVK